MTTKAASRFAITREEWRALSLYGRFEQTISWVLAIAIAVVILVAALRLIVDVARLLIAEALDPLDHAVFQAIFGAIMTVLIALEFNHSILHASARAQRIVQVQTVVLIALLALARKFIILDTKVSPASTIIGLSLAQLTLGGVYWLLRDRDRRRAHPVPEPDR